MKYLSVALLSAVTAARKQLMTDDTHKTRSPVHNVRDCEPICVFEDMTNSWCFETTTPHLKLGWEYDQTYNETETEDPVKYFRIELLPYIQAYFYMKSIFNVEFLYWNEFAADLSRFKVNLFFSSIINSKWQYCYGVGYENEDISFLFTMEQKMIDCYK